MLPIELSHGLVLAVFPFLVILAALTDTFSMTIPNRLTLLLAGAFLPVALSAGMGLETLVWHLGTGAVMLVICFVLFGLGWIGGGDAKLAAASSLWLGPALVLPYILLTAILGGVLTAGMVLLRQSDKAAYLANKIRLLRHLMDTKVGIPYGIALGAAGLITYTNSFWIADLTMRI